MTKLEKGDCAKIWDLSNPRRDSTFTRAMFFVAMHIMYKKR